MKREMREELDEIAANARDGHLRAGDVVSRARSPKSTLHSHFTWENTKAAELWRLEEARSLIRRYHVVIESSPPTVTRAFVSLRPSRMAGGGYISIDRILNDAELHSQLLQDALTELAEVEARYSHLTALQPVFSAARRVRRRAQKEVAVTA